MPLVHDEPGMDGAMRYDFKPLTPKTPVVVAVAKPARKNTRKAAPK